MNRFFLLALLLGSSFCSLSSQAQQAPNPMSNMFRAMADMMTIMAQMGNTQSSNSGGMGTYMNPMSMNPMSASNYINPQQWMMNPSLMSQATNLLGNLPQQMPFVPQQFGQNSTQPPTSPASGNHPKQMLVSLQGLWQGNSGEYLLISGNHFSIKLGNRTTSGQLWVRGNQLDTYAPNQGISRHYEHALKDNQLALRDEQGQIMLFQRSQMSPTTYPANQEMGTK